MDIVDFRLYCNSKKGAYEDFPFNETTLVIKVMGKMFALTNLIAEVPTANLKCNPEKAIELRGEYDAIKAGYHMHKKHWNTIELDALPTTLIYELIDHSYKLVVSNLTKIDKIALEKM